MELPHDATTTGAATGPVTDHVVDPAADPHVAAPSLVLTGLDGAHPLGPATIDSDADGLADTALMPGGGPDVLALATDLDHDGDVDVLTTLAADGSARTATLPDPPAPTPGRDGGWDGGWDAGWDAPAPPAPVLDPATGAWTRTV